QVKRRRRQRLRHLVVGTQQELGVVLCQVGQNRAERVEGAAELNDGRLDFGGGGRSGEGVVGGGQSADEAGQGGVVAEQADEGVEVGQRLAFEDITCRVLHEVGQGGAEVVEAVGEGGVAELAGSDGGVGEGVGAGDDDAHGQLQRLHGGHHGYFN